MSSSDTPAVGGPIEAPVKPRVPNGVVAILVDNDGREIATATEFAAGAPAGFSQREYQESRVRRELAMATMSALASPLLSDNIEPYTAEQIMRAMCNRACRVVIVPVGYDE